jgi:hypothetical protein
MRSDVLSIGRVPAIAFNDLARFFADRPAVVGGKRDDCLSAQRPLAVTSEARGASQDERLA